MIPNMWSIIKILIDNYNANNPTCNHCNAVIIFKIKFNSVNSGLALWVDSNTALEAIVQKCSVKRCS